MLYASASLIFIVNSVIFALSRTKTWLATENTEDTEKTKTKNKEKGRKWRDGEKIKYIF